jgi:hypothetical protein
MKSTQAAVNASCERYTHSDHPPDQTRSQEALPGLAFCRMMAGVFICAE